MLLLINNLHQESITKSQDRQSFNSMHAICNMALCDNFVLVLQFCTPVA